ncbi:anthranilate synthase component II [Actinobacillus equuli]|nr:anthranilate synthase component II [Actinobacillus equuli]
MKQTMTKATNLLIIDNHDSFTFNLVDLLRKISVPMKVVLVEQLVLDEVENFSHI